MARLLVSSTLSPDSQVRLAFSPTGGSPHHSPQSVVGLSFAFSQPHLPVQSIASGWFFSAGPAHTALLWILTGLVVLVDFFFNSLVVAALCSLIFWSFWLFMDIRLVVILLLVVRGSEEFLPTPPSWSEFWGTVFLKAL